MPRLAVFGLQVVTEVPLLVVSRQGNYSATVEVDRDAVPDVVVKYGAVAPILDSKGLRNGCVRWEIEPDFALADVAGVGRFCVRNGCSIIVDAVPGADLNEVAMFTWGPAWRALLNQRGCCHLHASAVAAQDRAVVFAGSHTSGKSSLAAALVQRGLDFLTDDICVIDIDATVGVTVRPGFAWQKLWSDTLCALGSDPGHFRALSRSTPKRVVPAAPMNTRCISTRWPLGAIYVIDRCDVATVEIEPILGHEKLRLLAQVSMGGVDFRALCALAKGTPVWRLRRPPSAGILGGELHRVADAVAVHVKSKPR